MLDTLILCTVVSATGTLGSVTEMTEFTRGRDQGGDIHGNPRRERGQRKRGSGRSRAQKDKKVAMKVILVHQRL